MKFGKKILTLALILIPLAVGVGGQPLADSISYTEAQVLLNKVRNDGDFSAETKALESILEFSPWRGEMWQRLGRLYLDTGQMERAADVFEKAAALKQLDDQGVIWLADALFHTERAEEARLLLEKIETTDLFILSQAAVLLRQHHFLDSCSDVLQQALLIEPENENFNFQLGVLKMAEQPDEALGYLRMVKVDQQLAAKSLYLADVISAYQADNQRDRWYTLAGQALSQVGEWDAAVESFRLAIDVNPTDAIAWALLAEVQQQIGEDGTTSLEKALALDPHGEIVNGLTGIYYRRQGDLTQALAFLQKALSANPDVAVWQIEIGGALTDAGRLEEALGAFKSAIEIDRDNPESWEALAKFSLTRNYRVEEEGLPAARQLVLLDPRNPVYLDLLGTAYLTLADLDSAEKFFLQALEYDPEEAAILIHLGQTSFYRGDKESAFAYLRRASASASDDRLREMADRLLKEYGAR